MRWPACFAEHQGRRVRCEFTRDAVWNLEDVTRPAG